MPAVANPPFEDWHPGRTGLECACLSPNRFTWTTPSGCAPMQRVARLPPDTSDSVPARWSLRLLRRRAFALCVLAAALAWPRALDIVSDDSARPELAGLVQAVGRSRPTVARITGGFAYAAAMPVVRSGGGVAEPPPATRIAAARLEQAARDRSTPDARAAHATGLIVVGHIDRAIDELQEIAAAGTVRAEWLADLSAALLTRSREGRLEDAVRALDAARRASVLNPRSQEAAFNLALAAESCQLRRQALSAWDAYLGLDRTSRWAREAGEHKSRLESADSSGDWRAFREQIQNAGAGSIAGSVKDPARFSQGLRELIEDELLPGWGDLWRRGDRAGAAGALTRSRQSADALVRLGGDAMPAAEADAIAGLVADAGPASHTRLVALAEGHQAFGRGRARFQKGEYLPAAADYAEAVPKLRSGGSPLWMMAAVQQQIVALQLRRTAEVITALRPLTRTLEASPYRAARARALWVLGLAHWYRFEPEPAIKYLRRTLALYTELRETENAASVSNTLAGILRALRERSDSWKVLSVALEANDIQRSALRQYLAYFNASIFAEEQGLDDAALLFQDAAIQAVREGPSGPLAEGLIRRAILRSRDADAQGARHDLATSQPLLAALPDRDVAEYLQATAHVAEARLDLPNDPGRAASTLKQAISFFNKADPIEVPRLHLDVARALAASGQRDAAERELQDGINVLERRRPALDEALRTSYFGDSRELFQDVVGLAVDAGRDPRVVLAYMERAKARTVLERLSGSTPIEPATVVPRLSSDVAIVSWFVLRDRIVASVVRSGEIEQVVVPISRVTLDGLVRRQSLVTDPSQVSGERTLSEVLIAPIASLVSGASTVVFVPHDVLGAVALPQLREPGGRLLLENHTILTAPSILSFLKASNVLTARSRTAPDRLLALADPEFDRTAFPDLPRLPGTLAEARDFAPSYAHSVVLSGREATAPAFVRQLPSADVAHVGAHGQVNSRFPELAGLILAPSGTTDGLLMARQLSWKTAPRTRLVVLAACRSVAGPYEDGEGVLSLARPFLLAGIPAVIGALWDVDDDASRELMVKVHRRVARGTAPARALQEAQLEMAASSDSRFRDPRNWGAFVTIGGTVDNSMVGRSSDGNAQAGRK